MTYLVLIDHRYSSHRARTVTRQNTSSMSSAAKWSLDLQCMEMSSIRRSEFSTVLPASYRLHCSLRAY